MPTQKRCGILKVVQKESINEMVGLLMETDEYVPIQATYNWFEALEICIKL